MDSTNVKFRLNLLLIQCIRLDKECLKHADFCYAQLEQKLQSCLYVYYTYSQTQLYFTY